jgi:hypothetical protein
VKNSKVLSICGNGNALGLFIGQNNQLTEYVGPKDPDINTLLHHLIYIANGKNIENISINNIVDINEEDGCFDMVFKLDGVFGRKEKPINLEKVNEALLRLDDKDFGDFIEALPSRLSKQGKAIILVPYSFLFTGKFNNLRSLLIDQNLLDIVIDVPNFQTKMLHGTNAKFSLIGIDMAKKNDNVFFVDKQYDSQEGILLTGQNDKGFPEGTNNLQYIDAIQNRKESHGLKSISCSMIKDNNYDLSVNRYVINDPVGIDSAVPLGDLFKELRISASSDINDRAFVLRINNLAAASDTNKNIKIPFKRESLRRGLKRLDKNALLITNRFNELKPTLYRYDKTINTPIYIDNSIIAFDVSNYSNVDIEALISELNSDFVRAQLEKYRVGIVMPYIRKQDLLKIRLRDGNIETFEGRKEEFFDFEKELTSREANIGYLRSRIEKLQEEIYRDKQQIVDLAKKETTRRIESEREKLNIEITKRVKENQDRLKSHEHSIAKQLLREKESDIKERQRKDKLILEQKEKISHLELEKNKLEKYKDEVQDIEHDINKAVRKLNRKNRLYQGIDL